MDGPIEMKFRFIQNIDFETQELLLGTENPDFKQKSFNFASVLTEKW